MRGDGGWRDHAAARLPAEGGRHQRRRRHPHRGARRRRRRRARRGWTPAGGPTPPRPSRSPGAGRRPHRPPPRWRSSWPAASSERRGEPDRGDVAEEATRPSVSGSARAAPDDEGLTRARPAQHRQLVGGCDRRGSAGAAPRGCLRARRASSSLRARSASTWCSRSRMRRTPSMPMPARGQVGDLAQPLDVAVGVAATAAAGAARAGSAPSARRRAGSAGAGRSARRRRR